MSRPIHCNLEIEVVEEDTSGKCDGCDRYFQLGEKIITGIESCCGGGCVRKLCRYCVEIANDLIERGKK